MAETRKRIVVCAAACAVVGGIVALHRRRRKLTTSKLTTGSSIVCRDRRGHTLQLPGDDSNDDVYIGLCVGGLEDLAVAEIRAKLGLGAERICVMRSTYDVVQQEECAANANFKGHREGHPRDRSGRGDERPSAPPSAKSAAREEKKRLKQAVKAQATRDAASVPEPPTRAAPGQAGVGKVFFTVPRGVSVHAVRSLRSLQALMAFVVCAEDIGQGAAEVERGGSVERALRQGRWAQAVAIWGTHKDARERIEGDNGRPDDEAGAGAGAVAGGIDVHHQGGCCHGGNDDAPPALPSPSSFRASCVRDGKHEFFSTHVAEAVGGFAHTHFGWRVQLEGFEMEVLSLLLQGQLLVGINLDPRTDVSFSRLPSSRREDFDASGTRGATLRPSVAWALLQLALPNPKPGAVVLDTMAGVGTVPIEAVHPSRDISSADRSSCRSRVMGLGGEIMEPLVDVMCSNACALRASEAKARVRREAAAGRGAARGPVEFVRWDAARLPLRTASVDAAVVDLPFGVRCGSSNLNKRLYPHALSELARVVRPADESNGGGRVVLMTSQKKLLFSTVGSTLRYWAPTASYSANIGGLCVVILVLQRTAHAPPADGSVRGGGFVCPPGHTLKGGAEWAAGTAKERRRDRRRREEPTIKTK